MPCVVASCHTVSSPIESCPAWCRPALKVVHTPGVEPGLGEVKVPDRGATRVHENPCLVLRCQAVPCRVQSCQVVPGSAALRRIEPCHVQSCHVESGLAASSRIMPRLVLLARTVDSVALVRSCSLHSPPVRPDPPTSLSQAARRLPGSSPIGAGRCREDG